MRCRPTARSLRAETRRKLGRELAVSHPDLAVYVRVNAVPTEWFAADVADACVPELAGIVVPKLESPDEVDTVAAALDRR